MITDSQDVDRSAISFDEIDQLQRLQIIDIRPCLHGMMAYLRSDRYIGRSLQQYGEYAEEELQLLKQILPVGGFVVDVGANIGVHSVFFAQHVGPQGTVLAFEPQRVLHQLLCTNLSLNGLINTFARQIALGSHFHKAAIPSLDYAAPNNFGGVSLVHALHGEQIDVVTLDSYAIPRCDLIKIDVEGMEAEVIAGAINTIQRLRPILYVEGDRIARYTEIVEALFALDYQVYHHAARIVSLSDKNTDLHSELFNTYSINFLALPKEREINTNLQEVIRPDDGIEILALLYNNDQAMS